MSRQNPPDGAELPLSFEAWAELSGRLAKLSADERFDLLDERDVANKDWERCDRHYALALADEIGEGRMERARVYAAICAAQIAGRGSAADMPSVITPPAEASDAKAESSPEASLAPETAVPTFLQDRGVSAVAIRLMESPRESLAATAAAFELPTALRSKAADALPFRADAGPSLAVGAAAPKPPPARAVAVGSGTIGIGEDLAAQHATLPFPTGAGRPAPVAYPRMPLQTHASLCAELAVFPEKAAEILRKYNVSSDAAHAALEHEWRTRLDAHPDTKVTWDQAFSTYSEWLRRQPR